MYWFVFFYVYSYAKFYGLPEPMDDIAVVLSRIAKRLGALQKGKCKPPPLNVYFSGGWIKLYVKLLYLNWPVNNTEPIIDLNNTPRLFLDSGGSLDIVRAAIHFIHKYRNGELGRITLDQITTSEQLASGQIST